MFKLSLGMRHTVGFAVARLHVRARGNASPSALPLERRVG